MRIYRLYDRLALFAVGEEAGVVSVGEALSARQRALLVGALNYHALDAPSARFRIHVYVARRGMPSSLTDDSTRRAPKKTAGAVWMGEFGIISEVAGEEHPLFSAVGRGDRRLVPDTETGERHIVLDADPSGEKSGLLRTHGLYWGARMAVERRFPFAYDRLRQFMIRNRESGLFSARIARTHRDVVAEPTRNPGEGSPAVLFGLHWLDLGGAERWALKTIEVAQNHGMTPIVVTDVASSHPWITRPEFDEAIVLPMTHPLGQPDDREPVLDAIVESWDIRGVYVHHCRWMYDRLPWLRGRLPGRPIVDSQHILEFNGGGYPALGVMLDDSIDTHHVISPQLEDWLRDVQGVPSAKIELAPLVGLTADAGRIDGVRRRIDAKVLKVGFVGRFAHQKRPYLFLKLVEALQRSLGIPVEAVIQGGGALEPFVHREIDRHGLRDVVTLRAETAPVSETLSMVDVLVITSQNEGLALTALESIAAGVPVVSTDVGSQRTVVAPEALVSRQPHAFLGKATEILARMAASEAFRAQIWADESRLADEFSQLESADNWLERTMTEWSR
ncbi:glycosyltransferase [Planctomonas sp. JC2975]|uniref:glycosyltransferase n=1 Tax=Planctomonas sp. JC2975 TaxID=2729626 RepID=UPI001474E614|nr:glycosyltransferase [Planctomonas sp. JC2975]NNC13073.1 glycosyltransferase [Planctomonas sp. JC2975]